MLFRSIAATNSGSGDSAVVITAEDLVNIQATEGTAGKVWVEGMRFQEDYLASNAATMILDPGDDRATSGKVQIMGDLQVDGTTTTVNSTVTTHIMTQLEWNTYLIIGYSNYLYKIHIL